MIFIPLLTFLISVFHIHLFTPIQPIPKSDSSVLGSQATTLQATPPSFAIVSTIPTVTTAPISHTLITKQVGVNLINCAGPDKKQFRTTQKACDDFNKAWNNNTNLAQPSSPWGTATKIAEHTYTIKVGTDSRMATASEIVDALNVYRSRKSVGSLGWDSKLGAFAQIRADSFASAGKLDQHVGFRDYLDHQDGFSKLGFSFVGENASFTGPLLGTHLIEWVFAGDVEHDSNQLNPQWTYVGIGVHGGAVDLIFGGQKR